MQVQSQARPNSALEHWVNSGEEQLEQPSPPSSLTQVANFDGSDHSTSANGGGGGSSSGHHSHEHSLEHALVLPNPPSHPPSSNLSLAFQSSPRSFDFRNSGSQPSSLRTSYSSYGNSDDALDSLRRSSYSATSDIRGTLEETRLEGDSHQVAEQWAIDHGSYVYPTSRRESEPINRFYEVSACQQSHRGSLPYPLERADSLPIRRLRRQPQPGSPGFSTSSGAPSLTDGSTSPSTTRSSFIETPYLGASPILEDVAADGRYPPQKQAGGYPFPDMYQGAPPVARHSISGASYHSHSGSSTPSQPTDLNRHGKRLSLSHDLEGERAFSPRPSSAQHFGSVPSGAPYSSHFGLPDPPKSAYDFRPESARATSPRGGVYDIDDGVRQVFLPFFPNQPQQHQYPDHQHPHHHMSHQQPPQHHQLHAYPPSPSLNLLPPHDGYDSLKKRRMSAVGVTVGGAGGGGGGGAPSPSLGTRREAASDLHLSGLPVPASSIPFDRANSQHLNSPSFHHYEHSSSAPTYSTSQGSLYAQQPRTPTGAPQVVRNGNYSGISFNSPAFLDNPPPNLIDSPLGSPYKQGHAIGGPAPVSPPIEPPCDLPRPPSSSTSGRRAGGVVTGSSELGSSGSGGTAFMDPNYPIDNFTICHRRPPQADFDVPDRLLPRTQDLRFEEDQYTPLWVRQEGKDKEGWCALCPGNGKWLQLKNSAFWYHRQFQHGISSSSGHYFLPPLETRPAAEGSKSEGLCHMCGEWKPYQNHKGSSNSAGKGPTPWFRHAHECHQYFSPKKEARKNMKLARSVN